MQENNVDPSHVNAPFTPTDEREEMALNAIAQMKQERETENTQPEPEPEEKQKATDLFEEFNDESAKQLLSLGLGSIQMLVTGVFDVPFEIDEVAGNKWLDKASPMLLKYGPSGLEWFGRYEGEIFFATATFSLIGGSAKQVRRLREEKVINELEAQAKPDNEQTIEEANDAVPTSH